MTIGVILINLFCSCLSIFVGDENHLLSHDDIMEGVEYTYGSCFHA